MKSSSRYIRMTDVNGRQFVVDVWRDLIQRRNIKYLVHITHRKNIPSIIQYGLMSQLEQDIVYYQAIDISKSTWRKAYVYCSISFPNYYYWRRLIGDNHGNTEYVVLYIDIEYLLHINEHDVLFYCAAPTKKYPNGVAFQRLFDPFMQIETGKIIKRQGQNLLPCFTTNPQATVLLERTIPLRYIDAIVCQTRDTAQFVQKSVAHLQASCKIIVDDKCLDMQSYWPEYQEYKKVKVIARRTIIV